MTTAHPAELLHEHDDPRAKSSTAVTGNGEEFQDTGEVAPSLGNDLFFGLEKNVNICNGPPVNPDTAGRQGGG